MNMKKLIFLLLLPVSPVFAQLPTEQKATRFDRFITRPEIEWAAYINDTIRFENPNLNRILLLRLARNEIRASLPAGSGSSDADRVKYLKKKDIDLVKFHVYEKHRFDSTGELTGIEYLVPAIDTASFTLTHATQIIYVVNGQVKTYVPWVSTMIPVVTSTGIYLGDGDYFSTCFNDNYNYQAGKQNKIQFLSQSKRKLRLDTADVRSRLKELYGRNLLRTIWPAVLENRFGIIDCAKNKMIKAKELDADLIFGPKIPVPFYDADGNQAGTRLVQEELSPDSFTSIELIQDWYYDAAKNVVFNTIREMTLYAKKWTADGLSAGPSPILKLVFK